MCRLRIRSWNVSSALFVADFWNAPDLERKPQQFSSYHNHSRVHQLRMIGILWFLTFR